MPAELASTLTATDEERLAQAEALVRGYCGWHIAPSREDVTTTFAWPFGRRLMLPSLYVTEVTSVEVDGVPQVLDVDYQVHQDGWVERLPYGGFWSGDLVEVTFTHGYAEVPADVTAVVQAIAQRSVDNPGSLVRKTEGPFTDVYSTNENAEFSPMSLLDSEKDVLRRYRIPVVG